MTTALTGLPSLPTFNAEKVDYRPEIDGLRGIAVIAVLTYHLFPDILPGGFVGVDMFFVISGFLITQIISEAQLKGTFTLKTFYIRRVRRIFPALILVIAACLLVGKLILLPDEFKALGLHALAGATFLSNLLLITESGYFDTVAESKPLLHLWSLGVEEQFYLVWPLLMMLAFRNKRYLQVLVAGLLVVSFAVNIISVDSWPTGAFFSPMTRLWELLVGAAIFSSGIASKDCGRNRDWLALLGAFCIGWSVVNGSKGMPIPGWWAVLPTAGTACLIAAGSKSWVGRQVLSTRLLVGVGLISYPLYLWHWPLYSFSRIAEGQQPSLSIRVSILLLSCLLAWLTYVAIERPIRRLTSGYVAVVLSVSLLLIGGAGGAVYLKHGFPKDEGVQTEYGARFLEQNRWNNEGWGRQDRCPEVFKERAWSYCISSDPESPPNVLLIGDSTANHFFPGLSGIYAQRGENLLNIGQAGCPPLLGVHVQMREGTLPCPAFVNEALQFAVDSSSVRTVILAMLDVGYAIERRSAIATDWNYVKLKRGDRPELASNLAVMESAMHETLERLVATNKHVILLVGVPMLDFDPFRCVDIRPWRITPAQTLSPCVVSQEKVAALGDPYYAMVSGVLSRFPTVKLIDTRTELCDGMQCTAMAEGRLLYRDAEHLSSFGSRYIAARLGRHLFP